MKPQLIIVIHAFIATDEQGGEGIVAMEHNGVWYPMVCADRARVDFFRQQAIAIQKMSGKKIVLAQFSVRTDVEEIKAP